MSGCKENVLEMIDQAVKANNLESFCVCVYPVVGGNVCRYCKIYRGLEAARACIVASVNKVDALRSNMLAVQAEIEGKLRMVLRGI